MGLDEGTFDFDLVPESGSIPDDDRTWLRMQFNLLEFMAAVRVERLEQPTRIYVVAWGEPQPVPPALLARLEERCGTRLRQVPHAPQPA